VRGAATLFGMSFRRMRTTRAVYAAGLARGSKALAILAPSGAGKTTLLLEMLRRGWRTFGDEFLLLERQSLIAQPFPLGLAIRESALPLCADPRVARACADGLVTTEPEGDRTFHGIDVADVFGAGALAEARPLTHVVLFERDSANVPVLEPIAPAVAALRILPHFFIDDLAMPDVWETIDAVARFACYRLRAPGVDAAASLLNTLATE
jgi:serine kinase of HPr protein (carbohydrate metabolism regulator)